MIKITLRQVNINLNASWAVSKLNDRSMKPFDQNPKLNTKTGKLNDNWHGKADLRSLKCKVNEFEWQTREFGREILYLELDSWYKEIIFCKTMVTLDIKKWFSVVKQW